MRMPSRLALLAAVVVACSLTGSALSVGVEPALGPETQVNLVTHALQVRPGVAALPDGRALAVWDDEKRVAGRLFRRGRFVGGELTLNENPVHGIRQSHADVCASGAGTFAVTWAVGQGRHWYGEILARVFDASGRPLTGDLPVSESGFQHLPPSIACDDAGRFAVTWGVVGGDSDSYGVLVRLFEPDGFPAGPETLVNQYETGSQTAPDVAFMPDGGFVCVWDSFWQEVEWDVFARFFDTTGAPSSDEFRVNQHNGHTQQEPSVAVSRSGRIAVAWADFGLDGDAYGVSMRWISRKHGPLGDDVRVNVETGGFQRTVDLAFLPPTNAVLATWTSSWIVPRGDPADVFVRVFAPGGALTDEILVNQFRASRQDHPAVTGLSPGAGLVVWQSYLQDGSLEGIFGRQVVWRGHKPWRSSDR